MTSGEIQYIADSILIEKLASLDNALNKEASLVDDIFSGVGSAVSSFVKSNVDTSSTGSLIKSVANLLAPAMFFKAHPLLGVLYTIGSTFGYNLTGMLSSVVGSIMPKITAGEKVTPEEVNQAGLAQSGMAANADLFRDLKELEKNGNLIKSAQKTQPLGGAMFGAKGAGLLYRLFGFLGQKRKGAGKSLMLGFIVWFVKTILLSAGLLAVGGATKSLVTGDEGKTQVGTPEQNAPETRTTTAPSNLRPSGAGQVFNANDANSAWYVPVIGKDITQTLLGWAVEIYPDLSGYEDIIVNTPSFRRARDLLAKEYEQGKDFVIVPPGFNRRIDIVNQFAGDAHSQIQRNQ